MSDKVEQLLKKFDLLAGEIAQLNKGTKDKMKILELAKKPDNVYTSSNITYNQVT